MVKPAARRSASKHLRESYTISGRRAARVVCLHRSTMRYEPSRRLGGVARSPVELATESPRYGYRMLTDKLHQEGQSVNHERVYRLYREQSLQLPKRRRKRIRSAKPAPLQPASRVNQRWSIESFNATIRDECLNANWFTDLEDARFEIERWRREYNECRHIVPSAECLRPFSLREPRHS